MRVESGYIPKITHYLRKRIAKFDGKTVMPDGSVVRRFLDKDGNLTAQITTKIENATGARIIKTVIESVKGHKKTVGHNMQLARAAGFSDNRSGYIPLQIKTDVVNQMPDGFVYNQSQVKFDLKAQLEVLGKDGEGGLIYVWNPNIPKKISKEELLHYLEHDYYDAGAYTHTLSIDSTGFEKPLNLKLPDKKEVNKSPALDEKFNHPPRYCVFQPKTENDLKTIAEFESVHKYKEMFVRSKSEQKTIKESADTSLRSRHYFMQPKNLNDLKILKDFEKLIKYQKLLK